jgi:pilus assembly protein FimV
VDFDIGALGVPSTGTTTDIPFEGESRAAGPSSIDFDLGAGTVPPSSALAAVKSGDADATVTSLDLNLDAAGLEDKIRSLPPLAPAADAPSAASGIDFDLNLDEGDKSADASAPAMDLSSISLDLGSPGDAGGAPSNDPKWQEVATKLDLAKAYEEMGDKDGARELLGEVMKDGDAQQKGQAQQLLTKLG